MNENDYIMLSALQHYLFCPRQCALIHLEQQWEENALTVKGNLLHEKVHSEENESRGEILICRGVRLSSVKLGLSGQADIVEFHLAGQETGVTIPDHKGYWKPFPVEYKRGKKKLDNCDAVQLCAQAMCLEEMLNVKIQQGALYYGTTRKRVLVEFMEKLRKETEDTAKKIHLMIQEGITPRPEYNRKCKQCSLLDICMPEVFHVNKNRSYLKRIYETEE